MLIGESGFRNGSDTAKIMHPSPALTALLGGLNLRISARPYRVHNAVIGDFASTPCGLNHEKIVFHRIGIEIGFPITNIDTLHSHEYLLSVR